MGASAGQREWALYTARSAQGQSREMRREHPETDLDPEGESGDAAGGLGHVYLVVRHEAGAASVHPLAEGASLVVGRGDDVDIRTESTRASRRHTRVALDRGVVHVEDLGSRNGTRLNADVLRGQARVAKGGDVISVGPLTIVIARADESGAAAAAPTLPPRALGVDAAMTGMPDHVIVADPAMVRLFQVIRRLAATPSTVLILGETGSGKEICAEQIHRRSARADGPFIRLNCASLPEGLLESELFGFEKGAFTGADRRRAGYFQAADHGTLLLDEIGEMPLTLQAKLLRVLEQRTITRLGGTEEVPIDVRILCATHRDLARDVEDGRFRRDLYYRVSTFTLEVPPLRERPAEVTLLAALFARSYAEAVGATPPVILPDTTAALLRHAWPGNVRELRNAMEHAVVMADGAPLAPSHLPRALAGGAPPGPSGEARAMPDALGDLERRTIRAALEAEGMNQTHAAKRLGISRRALIYKMAKYGLR